MADYVIYSYYRDPGRPLKGRKGSTPRTPDKALTASSIDFPFELLQDRKVKSAIWRLVWNPNTSGASYTLVKLMSATGGPVYEETLGVIKMNNYTKPVNSVLDITEKFAGLLAEGKRKQVIQLTAGTGEKGCLIYSSVIEVVWE